ncbi:bestrophin family protein [Silvibacterium sp.]|uniref:bestrophin family protein n=1 Tax=Silvibacterium sp. TaxID=1964179 RepID=UPI0039E3FDB2
MKRQGKQHWFLMLFEWQGSVLREILPRLGIMFLYSCAVVYTGGRLGRFHIDLNVAPFTLIGVAISIFLGFRNSASYDRFWEGRKLWGALMNTLRALARQGRTLAGLDPDDDRLKEWAALLTACPHALEHQLRGTDAMPELGRLLLPETCARLQAARFRPIALTERMAEWVVARQREERFGEMTLSAFDRNLDELANIIGGCERIANTPIPYGYSVIIHRTVYIYCALLPFGLLDTIGLLTPVMATFIAYTFIALETLASELENPFGTDFNDLPLEVMSGNIERAVLEVTEI